MTLLRYEVENVRKVCVFTSTRAEFGLLQPLIEQIQKTDGLQLQLIVSGSHLREEFGNTYQEIEGAGIPVDAKVEIFSDLDSDSDSDLGMLKAMGAGLQGYHLALRKLEPDVVVLLGDRFEALCMALASLAQGLPVGHIAGGEVTEGALDDSFRHSITKMAHLHFPIAEPYRQRIIQLGEAPGRVFNVGSLGVDNIKNLKLLKKRELEAALGIKFNKRNLIITFHPVTLERGSAQPQFQRLLDSLDELSDTQIIVTKANADADGRAINSMIDAYAAQNAHKCYATASLGRLKYLSVLQYVDAVVGNSSSGVVEAPSFKIGTVNIGDRQKGRIMAGSVIQCDADKASIDEAFNRLYSTDFQTSLASVRSPFGGGQAAQSIVKVLRNCSLHGTIKKRFFDLEFPHVS